MPESSIEVEELIDDARRVFVSANERFGCQGGEEDEAWELLEHAWGRDFDWDDMVPATVIRRFRKLVTRRETGEPVAYIIGSAEFRDLRLGIKPGMFVPRATSEFLAFQAIRRLHGRRRPIHVDLATGIGPVALATAKAVPEAQVWGLDISRKAVNQARANARWLGLGNATFKQSDMFSGLPRGMRGQIDVATIHPPYVPRRELAELPDEIKDFEPEHTLSDGSSDGLLLVRRIIAEGSEWLKPGGWLLIEIVPTETRAIQPMLRQAGYEQVRSTHGSVRYTRVLVARRNARRTN